MIDYFEELSRDRSPERRRELMFKITDQFVVGAENFEDRQLSLFVDIANRILADMTEEDQLEYGQHAAVQPDLPHAVVLKLAEGESGAALPVLEHSQILTEEDLIAVAKSKGQSRLEAIAKREQLGEGVTDVLVERGNQAVLTTVSGNLGANFSENGFKTLAKKSDGNEDLLQNLALRQDLPGNIADKLLPALDAKAAEKLKALMAHNQSAAIKVLGKVQKRATDEERYTRDNRLSAKVIAREIKTGAITPADGLRKIKGFGRIDDVALVAAAAFDMDESIVSNALRTKDGSPAAMLFKAADMSAGDFFDFEETRCIALRRAFDADTANRLYSTVSKEDADKALRFLKLRQTG